MRKLLAKRGVILSAAALNGALTANAIQAAPAGFVASVTALAIQGTTLTASTMTLAKGTIQVMTFTKIKMAVAAAVVALLTYQQYSNSVQARELDSARRNLRGQIEAVAARERKIAELEQQTTAIVDTRRSQELELERLRARQKSTANPGQATPAVNAPTTLLSATLQNHEAREVLRLQMVNDFRIRYGPFASELNVEPEEGEKLVQIAGDGAMKILEAAAAFTDGKIIESWFTPRKDSQRPPS